VGSSNISAAGRTALLHAARDELEMTGNASISLRAVARRAGMSHAAPAYFFGDRAGMLTAVAATGFETLASSLRAAAAATRYDAHDRLTALGIAYVEFGLDHPALVDLMFRNSELAPDDPALVTAQQDALGQLRDAVAAAADDATEEWSLASWALVHGLVTLIREGMLPRMINREAADLPDLARRVISVYTRGVGAGGDGD
jgi:AcrR family transcriptional regulator